MELALILSGAGFLAALSIHLVALFGLADVPLGPAFGLFYLLLAGGLAANVRVIRQRSRDYLALPPGEFWRFVTASAPGWMRALQIGLLLYAFFLFYFTMLVINRGAYPRFVEGIYVLERHKVVIETLSREQYLWHAGFVVRMLSGIAMAVNFGALTRWAARRRAVRAPLAAAAAPPSVRTEEAAP